MFGFGNQNFFMPPPEPAIGNPDFLNIPPLNWNMNMMNMNMNMNMMNMNQNFMMNPMYQTINEPWAECYEQKCFSYVNQSQDSISPGSNKINIVFKTIAKVKTNIVADYGQTMSNVLSLYLKKEGKENSFKRCRRIFFLFKAQKIDAFDETKVEDFFKNINNPLIIVNEMEFVIGA